MKFPEFVWGNSIYLNEDVWQYYLCISMYDILPKHHIAYIREPLRALECNNISQKSKLSQKNKNKDGL